MSSKFTGNGLMFKVKYGALSHRTAKQRIMNNFERQEAQPDKLQRDEANIRKNIIDAIDYLSVMNNFLPNFKKFDFRIERHRHNSSEQYSIIFRVGGSKKRYSQCVGYVDNVLPILKEMMDEQSVSYADYPLTPRAITDVKRLLTYE